MISNVSIYDFKNWFSSSNNYKDNFSWEGLEALFEYLEELEDSTGEKIEFDPIALCVEYTEYENFKDLQANYSDIKSMEDLKNNTTVIKIEGSDRFIIQDF